MQLFAMGKHVNVQGRWFASKQNNKKQSELEQKMYSWKQRL